MPGYDYTFKKEKMFEIIHNIASLINEEEKFYSCILITLKPDLSAVNIVSTTFDFCIIKTLVFATVVKDSDSTNLKICLY